MLNGLDLFSGIGGLSLALQPWVRTVCYVEIEPYCQRVLQARIADGQLDDAPIWDDVRSFDPAPWRGAVDIVSGGFPCQDISTAGRGAGLEGERSGLFREIGRIAGAIRPAFIYLENVAAIVAPGRGGWDVVGALAALGYDARWGVLSAYDVGAPHRRDRWWCLAHAHERTDEPRIPQSGERAIPREDGRGDAPVAHATGGDGRLHQGRRAEGEGTLEPVGHGETMAHAGSAGLAQREGEPGNDGAQLAAPFRADWWAVEPDVGRVAHGVPARVDRLRGLGNAVVPACAREAFARLLTGEGVTT